MNSLVGTTKVALNPLSWYLTVDGYRPELAPPLPEIFRQVRASGFGAVPLDPPASMTTAEFAELLSASGLVPAPGYSRLPFSSRRSFPRLSTALTGGRRSTRSSGSTGFHRRAIPRFRPGYRHRRGAKGTNRRGFAPDRQPTHCGASYGRRRCDPVSPPARRNSGRDAGGNRHGAGRSRAEPTVAGR